MFARHFHCPDCGGSDAYRSRRRNFVERYLLRLLFFQPVRCANCYRRSYLSMLVVVPERRPRTPPSRRQAAA